MNNTATAALRELAEKWFPIRDGLTSLYKLQKGTQDNFLSDLTACINEHYVEREKFDEMTKVAGALLDEAVELRKQHDIIVATADRLLLEVKELREMKECRTCNELGHTCWLHDPTNPDNKKEHAGYPLKFIEWLIKDQEIFFGELNDRYIINDNPHAADGQALNTIDAFYALWNEIQNEPFENTDI